MTVRRHDEAEATSDNRATSVLWKQKRNSMPFIVAIGAALFMSACGTTSTVMRPVVPLAGGESKAVLDAGTRKLTVGSCAVIDKRATSQTCRELQERVEYGLVTRGRYKGNVSEADAVVDLTITYFRNLGGFTRAIFGVLSGKDGMTVSVVVRNSKSDENIGEATISTFNFSALDFKESGMVRAVGNKIIDFLVEAK